MSIKNVESHVVWAAVAVALGVMGLGAWLVIEGHREGWWLVFLPIMVIFL